MRDEVRPFMDENMRTAIKHEEIDSLVVLCAGHLPNWLYIFPGARAMILFGSLREWLLPIKN